MTIKKIILLFLIQVMFWSCFHGEIVPMEDDQAAVLSSYLHKYQQSPADLVRSYAAENEKVLISGTEGMRSDLKFLRYIVPVLNDLQMRSVGFWFLDGIDQKILDDYFTGISEEYSAEDLLFLSDPSRTGFLELEEFLVYLKDFIQKFQEEAFLWHISGTYRVEEGETAPFLIYSCDKRTERKADPEERKRILLHNLHFNDYGKWELPFQGSLYDLMIHNWPLYHYSGINLQDSPFGELYLSREDNKNKRSVSLYFDGLILMGLEEHFDPLTPIEGFINESNTPEALESFPDQLIRKKEKPASYLMNRHLRSQFNKRKRQFNKFSEIIDENYPTLD